MASIGDASVLHIASSLARSIAGSESAAATNATQTQQGPSIGESIKAAFDGLIKTQQNDAGRPGSGVAAIEPFSPPPVPIDGLIPSLKEAIGAFRDLAGGKQKWSIDALDQQRVAESDMQRAGNFGSQQLGQLSDMQRAGNFGSQQLGQLSDMQRAGNLGSQQLGQLSDMQRAGNFGSQQLGQLSDMQRAGNLGSQQLTAEFDQQRTLGPQSGNLQAASPGVKMLDQCSKFFGLLDQIVAGDKDLALKANQMLR
jgi:hypothetical protein